MKPGLRGTGGHNPAREKKQSLLNGGISILKKGPTGHKETRGESEIRIKSETLAKQDSRRGKKLFLQEAVVGRGGGNKRGRNWE